MRPLGGGGGENGYPCRPTTVADCFVLFLCPQSPIWSLGRLPARGLGSLNKVPCQRNKNRETRRGGEAAFSVTLGSAGRPMLVRDDMSSVHTLAPPRAKPLRRLGPSVSMGQGQEIVTRRYVDQGALTGS